MLCLGRQPLLFIGTALLIAVSAGAATETCRVTPAPELPDAARFPASKLEAGAQHAFPSDRAILTLLHYSNSRNDKHVEEDRALPFMKEFGVNHCWGWAPGRPAPDWLDKVHLINLTVRGIRARNENEWMYVYLRTPWHEHGDDPLSIDLLDGYFPRRFFLPRNAEKRLAYRVEEKESRGFLPPAAYRVDAGRGSLTVEKGKTGRRYRVIFLAGDKGFNHLKKPKRLKNPAIKIPDGTVSTVKKRQFAGLENLLEAHPDVAVIRPTTEIFDRVHKLGDPQATGADAIRYYGRHAYWQGMHPDRLERFEERYGEPFDPRWVVDHGFGENGYVPHPGYKKWIDLIRNDLHAYVRERNNLVHDHGSRVRVFYGDNFVGLEPYLGDIEHNGYDEIVMGMDAGPGSVRFMTDFPGSVRRITRFQWSGLKAPEEETLEQFRICWRWMKREALFRCQDGFTMGGLGTKIADMENLADETMAIYDDFRKVYDRVHGKAVFTHPGFNVYVLSAWGKMRSWDVRSAYLSQRCFNGLAVDLPVKIRWLSFDAVIEDGVPEDAEVVILNGEPGTAWGGGRYWRDERLADRIRKFVTAGGGLLAMGAPTLVDGKFALSDVLGVEYAGAPNRACEENLWNSTRWSESGRAPEAYPAGGVCPLAKLFVNSYDLPRELRGRFDDQGAFWTVRYPAKVRHTDALPVAHENFEDVGHGAPAWRFLHFKASSIEKSDTGVFVNDFGQGRSVFIGGYGATYALLKPLLFYAADRMDELDRLNSGHDKVAVYFYPESRTLIAYNHSGRKLTTAVRFDSALAGVRTESRVVLQAMDQDMESPEMDGAAIRAGFPVTLDAGQAAYWIVGEK